MVKAIIEYCPMCDSNYLSDLPHECTMIISKPAEWTVLENNIWNAAIEAAASTIDRLNREGPYMAITGATEIRKLKK